MKTDTLDIRGTSLKHLFEIFETYPISHANFNLRAFVLSSFPRPADWIGGLATQRIAFGASGITLLVLPAVLTTRGKLTLFAWGGVGWGIDVYVRLHTALMLR